MRLGDLDALEAEIRENIRRYYSMENEVRSGYCTAQDAADEVKYAPTIDAVPVVRCKRVKEEILQRMDEFIAEYRSISESTVDHFGGKADAMDVARRLVNAALTDLCSYGERKDGA